MTLLKLFHVKASSQRIKGAVTYLNGQMNRLPCQRRVHIQWRRHGEYTWLPSTRQHSWISTPFEREAGCVPHIDSSALPPPVWRWHCGPGLWRLEKTSEDCHIILGPMLKMFPWNKGFWLHNTWTSLWKKKFCKHAGATTATVLLSKFGNGSRWTDGVEGRLPSQII